jgi:CO/xanthine dehydrogenase Mo-binding subunit
MTSKPGAPPIPIVEPRSGVVGRSSVAGEFADKISGALAYAADRYEPGMLYAKLVRSILPSAEIRIIDTAEAEGLTGTVAILTASDVPHNVVSEEASGLGMNVIETPVLAEKRVRYAGEPIAIVIADSPHNAEAAAEAVLIDYKPLAGVYDADLALQQGSPAVHEHGNLLVDWNLASGDVDASMAQADHVIEAEYHSQAVDHAYLEPEAGVGWIDSDGVVTLRVATQVIEHATELAALLGLPANRLRVIATYMGGGFGGKEDMTVEPFLALAVWKTRRKVQMVWSRQESLLARPKRHPFTMRYRTGFSTDGTIMAQDIDIVGDAGAYPYLSPRVLFAGAVAASGPYRCDNTRIRSRAAFTNNVPNSAFRGFGAMQVTFGYESQLDRIASVLGLDAAAVRAINFLREYDTLPTGEQVPTRPAIAATMRAALDALPLDPKKPPANVRRGRGFACSMQPYGRTVFFQDRASSWVGLQADGTVIVRAGVTDLGGGQAASLGQIAGEVLGVDPERVVVHIGDTHLNPLTGGTFATRQLYMSGNAVLKTALELRDSMANVAADLLGAAVEDLTFADNGVGAGSGRLTTAEWVQACERARLTVAHMSTFFAESGDFDPRTGRGRTFPDYTFGTHAAEVSVDIETGVVKVLAYVGCHDVGRAINPMRVEGQIQGGVAQGLGYALSEEIVSDNGTSQSVLFADYLMPTSLEVPDIIPLILEEVPGKGPFGARGIGEPAIAPVAATIASAIENAIGVRPTELPITPERILALLDTK